jgi:DNA processing protein
MEEAARSSAARVVRRGAAEYPSWLGRIHDPPAVLWVRGHIDPDEGTRSVAIVGARAATPLGQSFARVLAADLAAAGLTIVSGLARGIDTAAHVGALEAGGRTVAVLGSGIDRPYPQQNARLAEAIAATGALVSEFPPGTEPWKSHFPRRNRTIAGWSRLVVVVEAGERSGALITARVALDEGRDVMAVPGHPSVPAAAGTNALLRDGAAVVRDARDVLAELGLRPPAVSPHGASGVAEDPLLRALPRGVPATLEEIAARAARPLPELLARLSELELAGAVRRVSGALFVRS